jgi:hypothetical protein
MSNNLDTSPIIDPISLLSENNELAVFDLQYGGKNSESDDFFGGAFSGVSGGSGMIAIMLGCTICVTCITLILVIHYKSNC